MDLAPVAAGERGLLSTGVRLSLRPPPNTDGNYGRLEAINLETKKSVWVHRQRATSTTGALATAGGLVFAGYVDRGFAAFDDATGKKLWRTRLTDVPNSNAISYAVNGKQYIAVVAGNGGNHAQAVHAHDAGDQESRESQRQRLGVRCAGRNVGRPFRPPHRRASSAAFKPARDRSAGLQARFQSKARVACTRGIRARYLVLRRAKLARKPRPPA